MAYKPVDLAIHNITETIRHLELQIPDGAINVALSEIMKRRTNLRPELRPEPRDLTQEAAE